MRSTISLGLALLGTIFATLTIARPPLTIHLDDSSGQQKPLTAVDQEPTQREPLYPYTLKEHAPNAEICDAGSKQFTGTVSVSDEKKLFFWFFESRNDPQNSPVTIWINGGPGGSSLMGLFLEIGPCGINKYNNGTFFEKHSWTEFTNLLVIDQPAGVGFSTVNGGGTGGPDNIAEAAEDFSRLLMTFFADIFPQYSKNPLHIAGESFGGRYVPGFIHYIYSRLQQGSPNVLSVPVQSIILVDAVIDTIVSSHLGLFEHFCNTDKDGAPLTKNPFNSTTCDALEEAAPECDRLVTVCRNTYDLNICETAMTVCAAKLGKWYWDDVYEGGRDPYDDRRKCGNNPPICEPWDGEGGYSTFANRTDFKVELGFPEDFNFSALNEDLSERWAQSKAVYLPSTREMGFILDKTDIRVLVLNGNNDVIVNTEGQKRVYDALSWRRQASFRMHEFVDWEWPGEGGKLTKGGTWKQADDGVVVDRLAFFTIDEAGHASPGDQREAVTWLVGCWTGGRKGDQGCPV